MLGNRGIDAEKTWRRWRIVKREADEEKNG
jgi:hypothetical protein